MYNTTIEQCAALCNGPPPFDLSGAKSDGVSVADSCTAFEVYDPDGISACFRFYGSLSGGFTPTANCFACVKN